MTDSPPFPLGIVTAREHASHLINAYAHKSAILEAATSETKAQIAALTAALNKAATPHLAELDAIADEAKKLALEFGPEIFGEERHTLIENGYCLGTRTADVVTCDDEAATITALMRESAKGATEGDRLAASACLRLDPQLNKQYILSQFDSAPEWFALYGIGIAERVIASLKPAPKPRTKKASKLKAAEQAEEQEAA